MRILVVAPMLPQREGPGAIPVLLYAQLVGLGDRHEVTLVAGLGDEPGEEEAAAQLAQVDLVDLHIVDRRRPASGLRRWRRRWRLAATWMRGRWPWRTVWFADPAFQAVLEGLA